jgi:hypothetical protein
MQLSIFFIGKESGVNDETKTQRNFQGKTGPSPLDYIYCELGVLPVFKLIGTHKKFASVNFAQFNIAGTHQKFTLVKAHGLGSIATTPTLVKHQVPVLLSELMNQLFGIVCNQNSLYHAQ